MQLNIPFYSDLGDITNQTAEDWQAHYQLLLEYNKYFTGAVFKEKVPIEKGADEEDAPLLYPVGINIVRMLALSQADAVFGTWNEEIFRFGVRTDEEETDTDKKAIQLASEIMFGSDISSLAWELEVDRNVYCGGAFKIVFDIASPGHIKWRRVKPGSFYPIYDPDDPDKLLEVYIYVEMTREQAKAKYGINSTNDVVARVEHWTSSTYENKVDGKRIDAYSGVNPWGVVPFVYIPRMRTSNWWGDALTAELMEPQDEINMRIADLGEAINYNAHPIRWGRNLPRSFSPGNFPIASDMLWDLGKTLGQSPPPEVGVIEIKNPVSEGAFNYVEFLYDWSRTSSFSPPIAFGEDEGGGQRSGATLEIRMWPLIRAVKRSRGYLEAGYLRALNISAKILKQKKLRTDALNPILESRLVPHFAEIMPRDHGATVDEVVKLLSLSPPAISLETAQKLLNRGPGEVERIKKMLDDPELKDLFMPQATQFGEKSNEGEDDKASEVPPKKEE